MEMTPELDQLKQFMLDHFDFDSLKEAGFWPKGTRRADFKSQAARVCQYFGYKTVYEYGRELAELTDVMEVNDLTGKPEYTGVVAVSFPDSVNENGEIVAGAYGILSTTEGDFECPHCTCPQSYKAGKGYYKHKCTGCKRTTPVAMDCTGKLHIFES
jgi:hypothetical protein